jgi:nucleotide-binding universal stress UspA family protein
MTTSATFARILVPTDFSPGSEEAWSVARRVAGESGAELVLLHVLPLSPLDLDARLAREERKAELRSRQAEHQLAIPRADDEQAAAEAHVFEGPLTGTAIDEFSYAGREWAALLERWADEGRRGGLKVHTALRVGEPYREIVEAVKDEGADLVLLATHGRGMIHRLLVGSVADRVIRMAPCPVLTLGAQAQAA